MSDRKGGQLHFISVYQNSIWYIDYIIINQKSTLKYFKVLYLSGIFLGNFNLENYTIQDLKSAVEVGNEFEPQ